MSIDELWIIKKVKKKNMKSKKEIKAIHWHDIDELIKNLGFFEDFKSNNIKCQFCQDIMQKNNFGAIFPFDKGILFSCSKLECISKLPKE